MLEWFYSWFSLLTSQIRIRVGEYDFSHIQEEFPYVERAVARKVVHPKYNFFTYEFDLALVQLDSPLEFAPHIAPICLPGTDDLLIGRNATGKNSGPNKFFFFKLIFWKYHWFFFLKSLAGDDCQKGERCRLCFKKFKFRSSAMTDAKWCFCELVDTNSFPKYSYVVCINYN